MKLAIYYHIPIYNDSEGLRTASYFGLFIDALAQEVEKLVCFMHASDESQYAEMDYVLQETNVEWVDLGPKTHILKRYFFQDRIIGKHKKQLRACDGVLVRVPSPIFKAFERYHRNVWFLVVGSYGEAVPFVQGNVLKKVVLRWLLKRIDRELTRLFSIQHVLVNSQELWNKLEGKTKSLSIIKTTTITSDSFYSKEILVGDTIRLLYAGRIDFAKGLMELSDAVNMLLLDGKKVTLTIVGWEDGEDKPVSEAILKRFEQDGNQEKLRFLPRQPAGEKLNQYYREADIYVIPSYHEGFPRTIWEAMSQSTLVVASKVGSIPHYLSEKEAYLIPPKSSQAVYGALNEVLEHPAKANEKVKAARMLVAENTLEKQTKKLVEIIKKQSI